MFKVDGKDIYCTRGDCGAFGIRATVSGEAYSFRAGNTLRINIFEKKNCANVVLSKDFKLEEDTQEAQIYLGKEDTRIGDIISKAVDYWYEITLNPETKPQTIVGFDEDGPKIFKLLPEGKEE